MDRVYIESPFAKNEETGTTVDEHIVYLRRAMADCIQRGEAPYASHALYTQPGVLDDTVPEEREKGMAAGFEWQDIAQKVVVYVDYGISRGMIEGVNRIRKNNRCNCEVELRSIGKNSIDDVSPELFENIESIDAYRVRGDSVVIVVNVVGGRKVDFLLGSEMAHDFFESLQCNLPKYIKVKKGDDQDGPF